MSVFCSDDIGVNVESVSPAFVGCISLDTVVVVGNAGVVSVVKWQENSFNSWLRTGRTTLTESVENNERRILFTNGGGGEEIMVDFNSTWLGDFLLLVCFSAINASRSETRGVDDDDDVGWITVAGVLVLILLFIVAVFDWLTIVCAGRGRVIAPVTTRNCSGDFDNV